MKTINHCLLLTALAFSMPVLATPVIIDFSAILDTGEPKPPGLSTGDVVNGSIFYDLDFINFQFNDADNGGYSFQTGASLFEFSVGGFTRSAELSAIQLSNSYVDEIIFWVDLPGTGTVDEQWSLTLRDPSASAWNTTFLENIPVATIANLSLYSGPLGINKFSYQDTLPGPSHYRLGGEIGSLSEFQAPSVPEPGPIGLFSLAAAFLFLARTRRELAA